jgi:hypothetical protein
LQRNLEDARILPWRPPIMAPQPVSLTLSTQPAVRADRTQPGDRRAFDAAIRRASRAHPPARAAGVEVALQRTPLSAGQARDALAAAWKDRYGTPPDEPTLKLLVAQWAHETGNGASMYNYNFGGIKGTGPTGLTAVARTTEGYGASERSIRDHFRAYHDATEGARDYLDLLSSRFPEALEQARTGDPVAFVEALHRRGYFTGSKEAYAQSIARLSGIDVPDGPSRAPFGGAALAPRGPATRSEGLPGMQTVDSAASMGVFPGDEASMSMITAGLVDAMSQSAFRILAEPEEATQD